MFSSEIIFGVSHTDRILHCILTHHISCWKPSFLANTTIHKSSRLYTFIANDVNLDPSSLIRGSWELLSLISLVIEKDEDCG